MLQRIAYRKPPLLLLVVSTLLLLLLQHLSCCCVDERVRFAHELHCTAKLAVLLGQCARHSDEPIGAINSHLNTKCNSE